MSNIYEHWHIYTQEVLAWAVGDATSAHVDVNIEHNEKLSSRLLEYAKQREWYIFLGCDGQSVDLARKLAKHSYSRILIIEDDLPLARSFLAIFKNSTQASLVKNENLTKNHEASLSTCHGTWPSNMHLLADTSPWALFFLTNLAHANAPRPDNTTIQWAKKPPFRSQTLMTWRKLFLGTKPIAISNTKATNLKLSVAAIVHPDESHLDDFFSHIPQWVHEVVVIWDGPIPNKIWPCTVKILHHSRALNKDFSAQRNAMLKLCSGDYLLYLDADERLTPKGWEDLQYVTAKQDLGIYFPRMTFEKDERHVRMGHGLWPDVQLRFFPITKDAHFVGSVHEKVAGLNCNFFLAPHIPILHYSHIYKDRHELRQRLATFSASGNVEHKLSNAYPRLNVDFFNFFIKHNFNPQIFQLPI